MKRQLQWRSWLLFCLVILLLPAMVQAQAAPSIKNLQVELWPEYDQPGVLLIYRVELKPDTPLPAQVSFRLPDYIETMHVVAVEQNGSLFEVKEEGIELQSQEDDVWLTFATPSHKVQFEYYDTTILTRQEETRHLAFEFIPTYQIETALFKVQEPFAAEDFSVTPEASDSYIGGDGLQYNTIEATSLAPDEPFTLFASYRRITDDPSVQNLKGIAPEPMVDIVTESSASSSQNIPIGYVMVGTGLILLLGIGAYLWWVAQMDKGHKKRRVPRKDRRSTGYKKQAVRDKQRAEPPVAQQTDSINFCPKCGTAFREESRFCHTCGTQRYRD